MMYIGLGSNVGDRVGFLQQAIDKMENLGTVRITSKIYETDPWGNTKQPAFLNQCIGLETQLEPTALLRVLKHLEQQLGRTKREKWGPREIDIDILLSDDIVIESPLLTLPHPFLHERAFVLAPLNEIAPKAVHPTCNKTISELLKTVDQSSVRVFI